MASMHHTKAKEMCKAKIVLYLPESDLLKAFENWVDVLSFIQQEKPACWWLDALEPPDYDICQSGSKLKTPHQHKMLSLIDVTGCDVSMLKLLCPWSMHRSWERTDGCKEDKSVFNEKMPRNRYSIGESLGDEIMLCYLNLPIAGTSLTQSSVPRHPIMPYLSSKDKWGI